ncbi:MAG: GMC family oxidoreductase [Candidatus Contendobacter sp.]|nr:GMC family oxidoreductase [Candidatus Contendobacter sp.]
MESFDVVIIGSGAGGAPIAHTLARASKSVLVLDKGPLLRTQEEHPLGVSDFKRDELYATGAEKKLTLEGVKNREEAFYSSHVEPDLNDEPHIYEGVDGKDRATIEGYTAQVVGGGTQLYGAVSLRFSEIDFRLASFNAGRTDLIDDPKNDVQKYARDWPISYADLEPYYCEAERLVGINGTRANQGKPFSTDHYQTPYPPNPISAFIETGMDALFMPRYRTPLAVITQDHAPSGRKMPQGPEPAKTGYVNRYGDPLGLKSNTWVTLIRPLKPLPNFTLRANCVVTHLEASGDKITKVVYRDAAGRTVEVAGTLVVVACSAIESVRLLLLSAERDTAFKARINGNGLLGEYFLTHCFGGAEAIMPGRYDKSISLDSDWATDACASDVFIKTNGLWAGGAIYNNTSDQALPISLARTHGSVDMDTMWTSFINDTGLTGDALNQFFDANFGTRLSVSFMANQVPLPTNRIELHPTIRDKWGRLVAYIRKDWHSHDKHLMNVFAGQCRRILAFGGDGGVGNYQVNEFGAIYSAENARARIANHILGGARFGTNPADSVLDPQCRAWNFDNLYVTDGGFMPTSGGANPTLTIQANALRVADHLLTRV